MASRPVFFSSVTGTTLVQVMPVDFVWYAGMAKSRKQLSISSLHEAIKHKIATAKILEISSASESELGQNLSAFNLTFPLKSNGKEISVECAFQASKVFENGGPYVDLMNVSPLDAKRDPRLQSSGRLMSFMFSNEKWSLEPQTAFYDWVYINALHLNRDLSAAIMAYDTFTDIAFNPKKSINCQAGAVALYVSLRHRNLLQRALKSRKDYLDIISGENGQGVRSVDSAQGHLF